MLTSTRPARQTAALTQNSLKGGRDGLENSHHVLFHAVCFAETILRVDNTVLAPLPLLRCCLVHFAQDIVEDDAVCRYTADTSYISFQLKQARGDLC